MNYTETTAPEQEGAEGEPDAVDGKLDILAPR
jgi:hypothetical protein